MQTPIENGPTSGCTQQRFTTPSTAVALLLLAFFFPARHSISQTHSAAVATPPAAPSGPITPLEIRSGASSDVLHLIIGHSLVLTSDAPLRRIYIGDPAVLQTFTSGASEVVLTARAPGVSSLVLWEEAGGNRLYTVFADLDPFALRSSLAEAFPGASIYAGTSEGRVTLTGSVASDAASEAAFKMASLYAKDVVNSLKIVQAHDKQVQLKLRIVEVDRTKLDQFGVNFQLGGRTPASASTQQFSGAASDPLTISLYNAKLNLGVTIQDLEQRQILQVLAEPTLTTLSGLPAHFLSGGEFPFPVIQGGAGTSPTVTIQFRPYGVKVEFTPTVNPDGSIRLKLSPEVSTLDYSNSVTISGFTIPALSTRRAETEVEIQDGQTFMVSGLLDHRTTEIMSKMPGIGDIPILGQLFRSKNFNHSVVELVILVTATVVDPLATPIGTGAEEPRFVVPNLDVGAFDLSAQPKPKPGAPAPLPATQPIKPPAPETR